MGEKTQVQDEMDAWADEAYQKLVEWRDKYPEAAKELVEWSRSTATYNSGLKRSGRLIRDQL